ncbi:MAG: hypothetical protein A2511_06370 [Deltaproteobacteria bacterium RIFOXYD12_FULL_50_9]|nr:MAG: hypothetical protein A2511_06370 [Deltaproteobacteria bacterium RIFOXYD12_FULL_50_9]
MKLSENDLEIDFSNAVDGFVFDQMRPALPNFHGMSKMHRVDFVVELEEAVLFVEIKDPGNPKAQTEGLIKFYYELNDGTLSATFAAKFIDSFVYRWAEEQIKKPVHYLNLVTLETSLLVNLSDEIAKKLPPIGKPVARWKRAFLENCQVFNLETWNDNFPRWPVRRISSTTPAIGE